MRPTIKVKLAATFAAVIVLSGVSMFISLQNLGALNDSFSAAMEGNVQRIQLASGLEVATLDVAVQEIARASQINTAIQQLDKVTQQNTSAAEQLQSAISFFRIDTANASEAAKPAKARPSMGDTVLASAPHMAARKSLHANDGGGFNLSLDGAFTRHSAA